MFSKITKLLLMVAILYGCSRRVFGSEVFISIEIDPAMLMVFISVLCIVLMGIFKESNLGFFGSIILTAASLIIISLVSLGNITSTPQYYQFLGNVLFRPA